MATAEGGASGAGAGSTPKRRRKAPTAGGAPATPASKAARPATAAGLVRVMPAIACPAPEMEATELEAPRTAVGLNMLYMAMAREETGTVTCERGRWLCDPESDATRIVQLTAKNQYETPNYVWRRMVALEGVNFDACATPLSAICKDYSENIMADDAIPPGRSIFVNPPYGQRKWGIGCDGIQPILEKLVSVDVKARGSKVVAMLPNWSYAPWFPLVLGATRIYYITSTVTFVNPFTDLQRPSNFMWPCIVAVFSPPSAPGPPEAGGVVAADEGGSSSESTRPGAAQWLPLDVDKEQGREKLRAFR
mmetsp:Transcript_38780/g.89367  ORF Transcript_38780/g.89367 Transcript_38780/m.89367 type:complete len:307 (+) Transcript_38780:134-1054(+)